MTSRYNGKRIYLNNDKRYKDFLKDRGVKRINQYASVSLKYPTGAQIASLALITHTWGTGSKLYKLAHKHYNDPTLWWLIAWFNKKPTESHFKVGDQVKIPLPLERLFEILEEE